MKKLFAFIALVCVALGVNAQSQRYMRVTTADGQQTEYAVSEIEKVSFYEKQAPEPVLSGLFSVSDDKQVLFSMGNLQYIQSTQTWAFAAEQYEIIGTENMEGGTVSHDATAGDSKSGTALADKIDLFGVSGTTGTAKWGISTSRNYRDYSGDFADWGQNIGDGKTWRTLTNDEWNYLFNTRAEASAKQGVARINLNDDGSQYANGIILLPDNWIAPEGILFKSGLSSTNSVQAYADYQTFTLAQWEQLEAAGAVFLPASGSRYGANVNNVQTYGNYWSATLYDTYNAYRRFFYSSLLDYYFNLRYFGFSVRLVQDVVQH